MLLDETAGFAAPKLSLGFPAYDDDKTKTGEWPYPNSEEWFRLRQQYANLDFERVDPKHFVLVTQTSDELWACAEFQDGLWQLFVVPEEMIDDDLLPKVDTARPRVAGKQTAPNAPCPCGKKDAAGKVFKFKRCCGR